MKMLATIQSSLHNHRISVSTNDVIKEISIPPKASGFGSSINGGELLLLSLATCYCNDIYREAAKRNITITDVHVEASCSFGSEGEPGSGFVYKVHVASPDSAEKIKDLIRYTDSVAEVHNTLRQGISVTLAE